MKLPTKAKWDTLRVEPQASTERAAQAVEPRAITDREAHFLAREVGDNWLSRFRDNPSEQLSWHTNLFDKLFEAEEPKASSSADGQSTVEMTEILRWSMRTMCIKAARSILQDRGFEENVWSLLRTARAVAEAIQPASIILRREERGEYEAGQEPVELSTAPLSPLPPRGKNAPEDIQSPTDGVRLKSMKSVVEAWWKESSRGGRKLSTFES